MVHAAPTHPDDKKKVQQKETRIEQLSHIQEQPLVPLSEVTEEERSGLFTLFYMRAIVQYLVKYLLNRPQRKLGQSCTNSCHKIDRPDKT